MTAACMSVFDHGDIGSIFCRPSYRIDLRSTQVWLSRAFMRILSQTKLNIKMSDHGQVIEKTPAQRCSFWIGREILSTAPPELQETWIRRLGKFLNEQNLPRTAPSKNGWDLFNHDSTRHPKHTGTCHSGLFRRKLWHTLRGGWLNWHVPATGIRFKWSNVKANV